MSSLNSAGQVRTDNGAIVTAVGKKRSGKTALALVLAQSFHAGGGDMIVIDPAGDDGPTGPGVIEWAGTVDEIPARFPTHLRERDEALIVHYRPDAGSPTYLNDMDRVAGVALAHSTKDRPAMLLVHEMGVLAKVNTVPPHTRRILQHSRHSGLVCVFTMPRPVTVDPLVLAQADLVYTFELPGHSDRVRVAETIGWDTPSFEDGVHALGPHEYLLFDANEVKPAEGQPDHRLELLPALPRDVVTDAIEWSQHVPASADVAHAR